MWYSKKAVTLFIHISRLRNSYVKTFSIYFRTLNRETIEIHEIDWTVTVRLCTLYDYNNF
jgi:hypothetical protein